MRAERRLAATLRSALHISSVPLPSRGRIRTALGAIEELVDRVDRFQVSRRHDAQRQGGHPLRLRWQLGHLGFTCPFGPTPGGSVRPGPTELPRRRLGWGDNDVTNRDTRFKSGTRCTSARMLRRASAREPAARESDAAACSTTRTLSIAYGLPRAQADAPSPGCDEELFEAGDAHSVDAGHTPLLYMGTEVVENSPREKPDRTTEFVTEISSVAGADSSGAWLRSGL